MLSALILGIIFSFVELNCENLFDTRHDDGKNDEEYLPESLKRWTPKRYWNKLNNISKEIISCGESDEGWFLPDIVALCEIENDSVANDLCNRSILRKAGYEYLITSSPDLRGIDVALLYNPLHFALINRRDIRVPVITDMRPTRDILYVSGRIMNGDTLHIMVVHAPSRFGGEKHSLPFRMQTINKIVETVDSIREINCDAKIIIAGDFNDNVSNITLQTLKNIDLVNISGDAKGKNGAEGSYKYKGDWETIDHIIVSLTVADKLKSCRINDSMFLLEEDKNYGGVMPLRTYRGYKYQKGYSDHLPLISVFEF